MVAYVILISSDSFEESVGLSTSQGILFGMIPNVIPAVVSTSVPIIPDMAAAVVAPPAGVVDLDIHATLETDTFEDPSSPVHALAAPITSSFLCSDPYESFGDFSNSDSPDSLSPLDSHKTVVPYCRFPTYSSRPDAPLKRLRDPSSTYHHNVSVKVITKMHIKDSIETWGKGDIQRYIKSDMDLGILADIEADIAAEAVTTIEADALTNVVAAVEGVGADEAEDDFESSTRGTIKIRVDVVTEPKVPDDIRVPTIAESGAKETFEIRAITVDTKRTRMLERISVLDGSVMRLQETLNVERERTASIEHYLGYVTEELRQIQLTYQYDRMDFRRLETFAMRHLGYHP
nr:hypothetical protein [Tanacetum cinerariifolium]